MAQAVQIVVIGCGAIGLPIAVAFASRGAQVLGVDNDAQLIAKLAAADTQLLDDGLHDAMKGVWRQEISDLRNPSAIIPIDASS